MREYIPIRLVLLDKITNFPVEGQLENRYDSPLIDLLNACAKLNMLDFVRRMAAGMIISKKKWKDKVWENTWADELREWDNPVIEARSLEILNTLVIGPSYSIWWLLSDINHTLVRQSEIMVKLSCKASKLKDDDGRLKR